MINENPGIKGWHRQFAQDWKRRSVRGFAKRTNPPPGPLPKVKDVLGNEWDVHETRETNYGFDLMFGYRSLRVMIGRPELIVTRELMDFWKTNRLRRDGTLFDLPVGRSVLRRIRERFCLDQSKDKVKFWRDRRDELQELPTKDFAALYGLSVNTVCERRRRMREEL